MRKDPSVIMSRVFINVVKVLQGSRQVSCNTLLCLYFYCACICRVAGKYHATHCAVFVLITYQYLYLYLYLNLYSEVIYLYCGVADKYHVTHCVCVCVTYLPDAVSSSWREVTNDK